MIAIIDKVDSGKTRKLLNACSQVDGLFICAHPERALDKCKAYDIKPVRSASFSQITNIIDKEELDLLGALSLHYHKFYDEH